MIFLRIFDVREASTSLVLLNNFRLPNGFPSKDDPPEVRCVFGVSFLNRCYSVAAQLSGNASGVYLLLNALPF
jgi:hypothetical protein